MHCVKWLKTLNAKQLLAVQNVLKKFSLATRFCPLPTGKLTAPPRPPAVLCWLHFTLTLWETQSSIQKMAKAKCLE